MSLFEIYSLIEYIGNKDFSGNIVPPDKFNQLIKVVNIELFRKKYGIPEEYQPGRPIPNEFADITIKNTDDLKAFKMPIFGRAVANGILLYPSDYAHRDTFVYNYSKTINGTVTVFPRPIEVLREAEFASRNGNYTKRPTTYNPICVLRSDGVHIRPITITSVDMFYYRFPVTPVFSYVEADGYITDNPAASVQFEYPVDEHFTLTKMILSLVGINLRESDLVAYAEQKLVKP
jgi:hypothetical protein